MGFASCSSDPAIPTDNSEKEFYFGRGDIAILNYAYALDHLEAAFYTQVINSTFSGMTDLEKTYLTDIRNHEIAHRKFFKKALGNKTIAQPEFNLAAVNFASRGSVL